MLAFDPLMNEVHEFDLYAGDVFEAGNEVFFGHVVRRFVARCRG